MAWHEIAWNWLVPTAQRRGNRAVLYSAANAGLRGRVILKNGGRSDVVFEEQNAGRFRSLMLLPDEKVKLTAVADGFEPKSDTLSLPEGRTKELTFTLKPK